MHTKLRVWKEWSQLLKHVQRLLRTGMHQQRHANDIDEDVDDDLQLDEEKEDSYPTTRLNELLDVDLLYNIDLPVTLISFKICIEFLFFNTEFLIDFVVFYMIFLFMNFSF
ncbi:hypothetical protein AVEN_232005-1 [Araneus ventricosus]|uniref:Uncharacterized protein n=1 Tax=Araneus ventricosus TaxID=182803 RepID=A0A4Y1ZX01_ARAVE|nr:hypothetical protein AVEN_232005-1 [Araneus ventricosus]